MSQLLERKRAALNAKMACLTGEFVHWEELAAPGATLQKHHTQVVSLIAHLDGLRSGTQRLFKKADADGQLLEESRNIESLLLGLRRVWEFFRARLMQRLDEQMQPFLQVADELAWASYRPVLDHFGGTRRQPPLVFLNGGLSPFALARDQRFGVDPVPGQALTGPTYDAVLGHLPFPMIGVPWHQVAHLPDLPVVAHETGHAVENDFRLLPGIDANLARVLGEDHVRLAYWRAWSREIFADMWGCLTLGPAYASSLIDFLATAQAAIRNEAPSVQCAYPTTHLRVHLCIEALDQLEFDTSALSRWWSEAYPDAPKDDFLPDARLVARAILAEPLICPAGPLPLLPEIKDLRMTTEQWGWSQDAAMELRRHPAKPPESATTIAVWTAAARAAYDLNPLQYADDHHALALISRSKQLIKPDVRFRESTADQPTDEALRDEAQRTSIDCFDEFWRWSMA